MKVLSPVVWSEGMHLAQHHFQAQNRYFEELTTFAVDSLFFRAYGLVRCELDVEALLNGSVVIRHARGLMPDGLTFHFPEDETPEPLEITTLFSPVQDAHLVLLAIAPFRHGRANWAAESASRNGMRFSSSPRQFPDEVSGVDEKEVEVARKNFRLMLDAQDAGDLVSMPIARIRRDGRGRFAYDASFVPPCLQIAASQQLLDITTRLVEILDMKAEVMMRERVATQRSLAEYAASEVANFWFTHAVNSAVAPLRHLMRSRAAHPERLYVEMARLGGALCTFAMGAHPRDLPAYDHDDLSTCFDALDRHIRRHLELVIPSNAVAIPLEPAEETFYRGKVMDPRCVAATGAHWYLGVQSSAPRSDVATLVPRLVKVCSGGDDIKKLVERGLPGLALEYVPSPPSALSPRLSWNYFRVQTTTQPPSPCWVRMVKTSQVGVYVPSAIPDIQLEFTVVLEA